MRQLLLEEDEKHNIEHFNSSIVHGCDFQIAIHSMKFLGSLPPKELQSEKGPKNKFKKKIKKIRIYYIYIYILVLFYFIFFNVLKKPDKAT
jgi:hypothetical protein